MSEPKQIEECKYEVAKKCIKQYEELYEKERQLIESDEYISWLQNFTNIHKTFNDDEYIYYLEEFSQRDIEKIEKLWLMYDIVVKYATKNYINAIKIDGVEGYCIKFAGVGYNIGQIIGQGTCTYCNRVDINNEDDFINFEDIISNKKRDEAVFIDGKLQELSDYIKKLVKEENVPIDAINTCVKETLVKLK